MMFIHSFVSYHTIQNIYQCYVVWFIITSFHLYLVAHLPCSIHVCFYFLLCISFDVEDLYINFYFTLLYMYINKPTLINSTYRTLCLLWITLICFHITSILINDTIT